MNTQQQPQPEKKYAIAESGNARARVKIARIASIIIAIALPLCFAHTARAAITAIAAGDGHTCMVIDGGVQCWGGNGTGQLGNNSTTPSLIPVQAIPAASGATAVATGAIYTCAVVNGGVQCWGSNTYGQGGNNSMADNSLVPVQAIPAGSGATDVSAGFTHSCAVVAGGVQCWGDNTDGQLGNGVVSATPSLVPVQAIAPGSGASAVATDARSSCAVVNGGVKCWGANENGQMGNNSTTPSSIPVQTIPAASGVQSIAVGGFHSCAMVNAGVQCWGSGLFGRLGNNSQLNSLVPVQTISPGSGVTHVSAAPYGSCAAVNGGVKCWGYNGQGQLGNNSLVDSLVPVLTMVAGSGATNVASGFSTHSCALAFGQVLCWGGNAAGQLGSGTTTSRLVPAYIVDPTSGRGLISGGGQFSCAVVNGGVQCWGGNAVGQLGDNSTVPSLIPIHAIAGGSGATYVSSSNLHTCAVVNGGVKCWGKNNYGQLGNMSMMDSPVPVEAIAAGSGVTAVAAGNFHACALANGGVQCWGYNEEGALGNGNLVNSLVPVQTISAASGVTAIDAGSKHNCAIIRAGLTCWGGNSQYQIGAGAAAPLIVNLPTQIIAAGGSVAAIGLGVNHSCAVVGGGAKCWGGNFSGQLGIGVSGGVIPVPANVISVESGASAVAAGEYHTCAVVNGGVKCWGRDLSGILGVGATVGYALSPQQTMSAGSGATALSLGGCHSMAVVNGTVQSWGSNNRGELGINSFYPQVAPSDDPYCTISNSGDPNFRNQPVPTLDSQASGYLRLDGGRTYPVAFAFAPRVGVALNQAIDSNPVTVTGITSPAAVVVAGGFVRINNGFFTPGPATANNGDTVTARVTSSAAYDSVVNASVFIGGRTSAFQVKTRSDPAAAPVAPALALGEDFSMLLLSSGVVLAAGNGSAGQMGNGTTQNAARFGAVSGLTGVRRIAAGGRHALALSHGGVVWAWGYNSVGQLGTGGISSGVNSIYPVPAGVSGVSAIAAGQYHSLALKSDGTVWTWGFNTSGQLGGDCMLTSRAVPAQVGGLANVIAIAAGAHHSLAITGDGALWVWGANDKGQLGDGTTIATCAPVKLNLIANAIAVAGGGAHTLALTQSGALYAWGANARGQVGDATNIDKSTPTLIGSGYTGIAAGREHSFALKLGGTAFAWGLNDASQLGDGTLIDRNAPTALADQSGYVSMAGGGRHSGAITRFGEALLWGYNADGQLGNRSSGTTPTPISITPVRGTVRIQTVAGSAGSSTQRTSQTGANRLILKDLDYFEGDFGVHPLNVTTSRTYNFANQETLGNGNDIGGLGVSVSGSGFSLSNNSCPSVLLAGSDCAFDVSFQPPAPGDSTGAITIASNTASGIEPYTVLGTGIAPATAALTLSDKFLLYPSRNLSTVSEAETFSITNTGSAALTSLLLTPGTSEFQASHNCPVMLAANATCTASVTFTPMLVGARDATLLVQSSGGNASVSLSGIGAQSAADIDPAPFAFSNQTGVPLATPRTSNTVVVSAIDSPAPIWVAGGTYAINGGAFTPFAGTIANGQSVQVRHTSAAGAGTLIETMLSIGNQSAKFTSTTAGAPAAPTINSVVAGNQSVAINFNAPNDGGSAITSYTATGLPGGIIGTCNVPCSSITVTGLMNGTPYTFTLTATNAVGTGGASAASMPVIPTMVTLSLSGVVSRKTHGTAGTFEIPILAGLPISIEPRMSNIGHQIVFQFNLPITATGMLIAVDKDGAPVGVRYAYASGNDVNVMLTGVADNNRVTVTLSSVNGTVFDAVATVGFLVGDVNASSKVTAGDIASVKARSGIPVDGNNFKADVNASGAIDAVDLRMAKARAGLALP